MDDDPLLNEIDSALRGTPNPYPNAYGNRRAGMGGRGGAAVGSSNNNNYNNNNSSNAVPPGNVHRQPHEIAAQRQHVPSQAVRGTQQPSTQSMQQQQKYIQQQQYLYQQQQQLQQQQQRYTQEPDDQQQYYISQQPSQQGNLVDSVIDRFPSVQSDESNLNNQNDVVDSIAQILGEGRSGSDSSAFDTWKVFDDLLGGMESYEDGPLSRTGVSLGVEEIKMLAEQAGLPPVDSNANLDFVDDAGPSSDRLQVPIRTQEYLPQPQFPHQQRAKGITTKNQISGLLPEDVVREVQEEKELLAALSDEEASNFQDQSWTSSTAHAMVAQKNGAAGTKQVTFSGESLQMKALISPREMEYVKTDNDTRANRRLSKLRAVQRFREKRRVDAANRESKLATEEMLNMELKQYQEQLLAYIGSLEARISEHRRRRNAS